MIKLSKRLKAIADMVDNDSTLADIGCDHALLDIYLVQNKIIKKAIACDITAGALNQAKKNIILNGIYNIETRLSDGLQEIKDEDNIDTLVMSGLGDIKIINILKQDTLKLNRIKTIIIQSNTNIYNIRKYLISVGYFIKEEQLVKDNNIIYTIIKFNKGFKKYSKKELIYGPILLMNKDELFVENINNNINNNKKLLSKIPKIKIKKRLKLLHDNFKYKNIIK